MFRSVPESIILYPSDGVATERCVELAANYDGIAYLRTSRPGTATIYTADDDFQIGGSALLRESPNDVATVVAAGVTTHEAIKAADALSRDGTAVRVIDLYSVKPVDEERLWQAVRDTGVIVSVEDHYPQGGLGEAVLEVLAGASFKYRKLAVYGIPRSGSGDRLMREFGIDAENIVAAVKQLLAADGK